MELHVTEQPGRLEIVSPMPWGRRVLFGFIALVPLLAPYELLYIVRWNTWWHPFFFFALFISLGAMFVSGLLAFAALAGLESRMVFDAASRTFTYSAKAPIAREGASITFQEIDRVEVESHDWSDSAPSYSLRLKAGGRMFSTGSSGSRAEVESIREKVDRLLAAWRGSAPIPSKTRSS
jgi:hypothetical protein